MATFGTPLVDFFWSVIDLILHIFGVCHPIYVLIRTSLLILSWINQIAQWIRCDVVKSQPHTKIDSVCYQSLLQHDDSGHLVGVNENAGRALIGLGFCIMFL